MGDKHDTYVTAWTSAQERELLQKGWTHVGGVYLFGSTEHPVMAPPEPVPPTLAERLRGRVKTWREFYADKYASCITVQERMDILAAADALDHYALVEEAARKVVVRPHEKGNGVLVDNDLLWKLADALNEGRKAPGADSL